MTKGYFLRTKAVIRPSLLRNFEDLSRTCLGGESDKVRLKSYSDIVLQWRKKSIFFLCSVGFLSVQSDLQSDWNEYQHFFFVTPNENICQHDSPTEPRGVL